MKRSIRSSSVLLFVLLPILLTTDGLPQRSMSARAGDVANGEIVREADGHLLLNVKPCAEGDAQSYIDFHEPYGKRSLGNKSCPNGRAYEAFSIEQQ